ncbi:2-deoxyribose-5-phosphate aldolase [Methylobacterium sp. Leaf456]|uniref:deoxyribose-phosphate aldolase n=1 Tax=Methylobacterium sp. Leaf456 TaxID=1736382 RepID=UPI0006F24357|nr:deoxyribose-phosphate aldolase [Methylobacterium sp. Leaf456]KQT53468.1 2-deoxyribose-5-phosphate aldolase [Methylobacterium sp. Leaf456]
MTAADPLLREVAARALPLLDLTDLSEGCTEEPVRLLCERAQRYAVAAVCVWPRFVAEAAQALTGGGVRIATVVNFPDGGEDVAGTLAETRTAIEDGADEIDLVLPYRALLRGEADTARAMVAAVREACGETRLKVILETGMLPDADTVARASRLALEAGADFLKTSTGKTPVSATPEAAEAMLLAIREGGGRIGLKVSGGLRRVEDAARYLALADRIMGPDWVNAETFRIGASSLLDDLVRAAEAGA